jgi:hypothetical protein
MYLYTTILKFKPNYRILLGWMHGWVDQKRQIKVPKSPYWLSHMKLNLFKFFLYKFFVVYEIQKNQKNYNMDFNFFIKINIKID